MKIGNTHWAITPKAGKSDMVHVFCTLSHG